MVLARTRTSKNRDNALQLLLQKAHCVFLQQDEPCASNSSIMAMLSASSASVASWPLEPMLLLMNEKTIRLPLGRSAYPERVRTCSTDPVLACKRPTAMLFFMRSSSVPSTPATGREAK